jgi:hypothetical protein
LGVAFSVGFDEDRLFAVAATNALRGFLYQPTHLR